ncbi:MAG: histidine kinase [Crocinitomicaceae bacterium]|nr:histidine kinase [Crocinitomicaceae bacterium]
MRPKFTCFIILTFLLVIVNRSLSQKYDYFGQESKFPYAVTHYNAEHGLPQNQVLDIVESDQGIIASTANGISLFNGTFSSLSSAISREKKMHMQYKLFFDTNTQQLYGWTQGGNYNLIHPEIQQLATYSCIAFDDESVTGMQPDGTIITSSHDIKTTYRTIKTGILYPIAILLHENHYYVSTSQHLYQIDLHTGTTRLLLDGQFEVLGKNPATNTIYAIDQDLFCIDAKGIRQIKLYNPPTSRKQAFRDIECIAADELLITSSAGLYHVKNGVASLYDVRDGLVSSSLYGLHYYADENCVFVGTENNGLMILIPKKVNTYFIRDQIGGSQSFSSVVQDETGALYSAASKGHILRISNGIQSAYSFVDRNVLSLAYIHQKLYVGTWTKGLTILQNGIPVDSIPSEVLPSPHVQCTYMDSRGVIWVGTTEGLVFKVPSGQWQRNSIPKQAVISIYELSNGNLCFGSNNGFYILSETGTIIRHLGEREGMACKEVRSFYEDSYGMLWIGTYGGGLYRYYNRQLESVNSKPNCLLSQDVFTLARTTDGQLYMSSNNGIWSVNETKLRDFCNGNISYLIPAYYGRETGMINTEFNGGFQNNYTCIGSKFYFPSIYGLVELDTDQQLPRKKLITHLRSVLINDTITPGSTVFKRSTHTILFEFYTPVFTEQYNVYYQYKLTGEGLPDKWNKPQKTGSVTLKMLPPGDYTFSVRAIDCFNDASPHLLSYHFTIRPHFYETTVFQILLVLLVIGIIVLFVRQKIKKEAEKNRINNTLLELKLNAIHSKMNPHFMFNTLNNIVYLLTIENYTAAEELLQDFSLLLRSYLEKNDSSFITIGEEMEMIDLYLSIQQKRYNGQFDYFITYPEKLATAVIPSMLIQPFVENAIIHGLAHSKHPGKLTLDIYQNGQTVDIRIKDDGIGRKESERINAKRSGHSSRGIALIREKIRVMEQKYLLHIQLEITDPGEDEEQGTFILLNIPIYDKVPDC